MIPKKITNSSLNEEYFYMKHPSGLNIYVHPKRDYTSNYAILGTNFGSVHNKFKTTNQKSFTNLPDGTAHYLEHKLFESPKGDAFELFAKTGASANAFTSFEKTAFLFSCTENLEKSLEILLEFVQSPYFTKENVEKERGIIGQEITMYRDSPDWVVFINLLGALYHNHPVNRDIAGTKESISRITPELLYTCYNTFYNLSNMSLCIAGDFDCDKIFTLIDKKLSYAPPVTAECFFPHEPQSVCKKFISESFDIQSSVFNIGFKENVNSGYKSTNYDLVYTDILIKCMESASSEMYKELLEKELINTASFASEYLDGPGYSSIIFSGESKNPQKAAEIIRKHADKICKNGIEKTEFERIKKSVYGQSLSVFNSIPAIANLHLSFSLSGKEIFEYMDILENADINTLNKYAKEKLDSEFSALSVATPK